MRRGGSGHTPHLLTAPPARTRPAPTPGDPSSGEKALPVASKKRRETKILRVTVIPSSVPSSTFGVGLEQRLVKPHAQPLRPRPTLLARLLRVPDSPRGKGRESTFLSFFFPAAGGSAPGPPPVRGLGTAGLTVLSLSSRGRPRNLRPCPTRRVFWCLGTAILPPTLDILGGPSPPCLPTLGALIHSPHSSLHPMASQGIPRVPAPTPKGATLRAPTPKGATPRGHIHRAPFPPTPMGNHRPSRHRTLAVSSGSRGLGRTGPPDTHEGH